MKNFNFFEKQRELRKNTNQTGWLSRVICMLIVLLTLGVGEMWGAPSARYYLVGDPKGDYTKADDYKIKDRYEKDGQYAICVYATKDCFFRLKKDDDADYGPSSDKSTSQGYGAYNTNAWKYNGNTGIVRFGVDETSGDNGEHYPWVFWGKPTVYIRHKWNNSSSSTVAMTDNNDGTYKYIGNFSSSTSTTQVGPENGSSRSNVFKEFGSSNITKVGSPADKDRCIFEWNASGYNSNKAYNYNRGTLTVTKLYSFTYDGNGKTSGTVPTGVTDAKWNVNFTTATQGTLARTGYVFVGWNTASDGTGRYYAPGETYAPTDASMTLYAMWMQVHTAAGADATYYGERLTKVDCNLYEVYRYATSSNTLYINAGTSAAPTTSGTRVVMSVSGCGSSNKDSVYAATTWMAHSKTYGVSTGDATASGEFFAHNVCQPPIRQGQGYILVVTGYDQFSLYAKDANTSGDKKIHVYINNVDVTTSKTSGTTPSTSMNVRRYALTPGSVSVIRVQAHDAGTSCQEQGFSLRLPSGYPAPTAFSKTSVTSSSVTLSITDPENTNDYEFYYSTSGTAPTSGTSATTTSDSKTPTITGLSAETKYYIWVRSKCSNSCKSAWKALSGDYFTTNAASTTYSVSAVTSTGDNSKGSVSAAVSELAASETTTITASPATGYQVTNWAVSGIGASISPSGASNSNTTTLTMGTADATVTVTFGLKDYDVDYNAPSNGSYTTKVASGSASSEDKTAQMGQTVALVATPATGYAFSSWTITNTDNSTDVTSTLLGDNSTKASTSFTMPAANVSIVATFARLYTITKGTHSNGDFTISTSSAVSGTTITLTATPETGYVFEKWTTSGTAVTLGNANVSPTTFTMPAGNVTVNAVFKATPNIYYYKDATHYTGSAYKNPAGGAPEGTPEANNKTLTTPWKMCNACVTGVDSVVVTTGKYDNKGTHMNAYIKLDKGGDETKQNVIFGISAGYTAVISTKIGGYSSNPSVTLKPYSGGSLGGDITKTTGYATVGGVATTENNFNEIRWSSLEAGVYVLNVTSQNAYISEIDIQTTPKTYTITLKPGVGGSGSDGSLSVTYGASTTTDMSHSIAQTGYTISGWYTSSSVKVLNADGSFAAENVIGYITSGKWSKADNCDLYAWWSPNPYAVTFDATTNGGALSGSSPKNVIFDETSITSCPVGQKIGYVFDGWYTKASGGKKVINPNGSLVASITEDAVMWTNGDRKWKKTSATTVYAVYLAPTTLIEQPAKVAGKRVPMDTLDAHRHPEIDSVIVHQLIDPAPYGTCNISYKLCYSNHVQLDEQPVIHYGTGAGEGYDTVWMPMEQIQKYELVAYLRTGATRGEGDLVTTDTAIVSVENRWPIKVRYMKDGVELREPTQWYAYPSLKTTEAIRIPAERNGYILDSLEYGVGITVDSAKYIDYAGIEMYQVYLRSENAATVTAHYKVAPNTVYFFDTFEDPWYTPYIFDYGTTGYWGTGSDAGKGAGAEGHLGTHATRIDFMDRMYKMPIGASTTKLAIGSDEQKNANGTGFKYFYSRTYTPEGWDHSITVKPEIFYRTDFNQALPMFVPVVKSSSDYYVENTEARYFRGFWVKYSPDRDSTGYYLKVYDRVAVDGAQLIQSIPMTLAPTGEDGTWELTATMDLEGGKTYGFKYTKATGASTVDWYGYAGTMTSANHTDWLFTTGTNNCGLTTTSAGDYTFHLHCVNYGTKADNTATNSEVQGKMVMTVDYATNEGDYRVVYVDDAQTNLTEGKSNVEPIASQTIRARENGQDTVTFYIRKDADNRSMKFQKFNAGAWSDVTGGTIALTNTTGQTFTVSKDTTYQIYIQQNETGTSVEATGMDYYSGLYYIRTDCVDEHKWDYKQSMDAHSMVESDYASHLTTDPFTHYFVHWVAASKNVKFVVATQYSPTLTDTLITDAYANVAGGNLPSAGASVRFMYNKSTNAIKRAYLAGAQGGSLDPNFLKLTETSSSKMKNMSGSAITSITFGDLGNFTYQAEIQAQPGLTGKLTAEYNSQTQYFKGGPSTSETILGGTGLSWQHIVMTYDFKTNRLICAWTPGDTIDETLAINADIMIIRRGQRDAEQIVFKTNESKLTDVKYIYGVIQLDYNDLVGMMYSWDYWAYEHCMYYISFPFDVAVNDITGVGSIGKEWRIQRYNGAKRAEKGWFAGDGVTTFWEDVHAGDTLHAYEGYSLLLNRVRFNDSRNAIWENKTYGSSVYLFFPSLNATTGIVADGEVTVKVPSHLCTIDRNFTNQNGVEVNHKNTDSHWNMMGTPLFENKTAFSIADNPIDPENPSSENIKYLYAWNSAGNTLGIQTTLNDTWQFKTMYSYMVQYAGDVKFKGSTINKSVAARRTSDSKNYHVNLELTKDELFVGRTYVELRENAVDSFLLNEDVYMVKNGVNADLYTYAGGYELGANVLTMDNHIVPVGIDVQKAGTYTFSMPSNFSGTVTLIDNFTQTRTNLAVDDYEIALPKGTINDRFELEININKMPTAIDGVDANQGALKDGKAHKFIENDQMYILKDGVLYDARGNRVK